MNPSLAIYLYRNQLQLATPDAFYSDGHRYRPAVDAVNYLVQFLPSVKSVLVLGTGLGSLVRVLHRKGFNPNITLVEYDQVVLKWALELMNPEIIKKLDPVCIDANLFMTRNTRKYDLIFVDVFNGRVVPDFVTSADFLLRCRNSLNPGGRLVLNYIINNASHWDLASAHFESVFPVNHILKIDINRILISG